MDESFTLPGGNVERWLPVPGWEGFYEVSSLGRIRSLPRRTVTGIRGGHLLKPTINPRGYYFVVLKRPGEHSTRQVHRLVLEAFAGSCPPGMEGRHGPNGKLDNRASELCWGTKSENYGLDRARDGTSNRGERCGSAKLTAEIVTECKRRYAAGESQATLAAEFGVAEPAVSRAINGITWSHIADDCEEIRPAHVGDAAGERNTKAKLTWSAVAEIRRRYAVGSVTCRSLAGEFGVSFSAISRVVRNDTWRPSVFSREWKP